MTYSKLTYPISPPAQPDGLIETDHLHYLRGRLTRSQTICLGQLNGPQPRTRVTRGRQMRRWLKCARDLARLGREVFRLEKHNHIIKTKWSMLRDPAWRARVFRELGGEAVMRKWEARFAKAKDREPQPEPLGPQYIKPVPDVALFKQTKRSSVRTDRAGQFRLAPIERGPRAWRLKVTLRRGRTYNWDPSWETRERKFPPIPLTAEELRHGLTHNPHPEDDAKASWTARRPGRRTGVMATNARDPSRRGYAAPQDEVNEEDVESDELEEANNAKPP